MNIIPELMTECLNQIAAHYAKKIVASNTTATSAQIQQAVAANWTQITNEAAKLYTTTFNQLKAI